MSKLNIELDLESKLCILKHTGIRCPMLYISKYATHCQYFDKSLDPDFSINKHIGDGIRCKECLNKSKE